MEKIETSDNTKLNDKAKTKKELSPYQKFLQSQPNDYTRYKQRYFDFYDDVKDKTHKIIDW